MASENESNTSPQARGGKKRPRGLALLLHDLSRVVPVLAAGYVARLAIENVNWSRVWNWFRSSTTQLVGVLFLFLLGIGLYFLRSRRPKVYASIEAVVAMTSAWLAFSAEDPTDTGLKLVAAVYLLVRAFDNWKLLRPPATALDARGELEIEP